MNSNNSFEEAYIECQCNHFDHLARLTLISDGDLSLTVRLNPRRWYHRLWLAVRFVFGNVSPYGHYDELLLKVEQYDTIRDLLRRSELIKAAEHAQRRRDLKQRSPILLG